MALAGVIAGIIGFELDALVHHSSDNANLGTVGTHNSHSLGDIREFAHAMFLFDAN
ncbi:hypothetical protein N8D56_27815 (plasmid) [Devosia sp. A8/3-2]|nr:hypothetical protein N8D56_27815 [Devosia sp. A8/3-2]